MDYKKDFPMLNKGIVYLDNSATSPIDEEVRDAMLPYLSEEFWEPFK